MPRPLGLLGRRSAVIAQLPAGFAVALGPAKSLDSDSIAVSCVRRHRLPVPLGVRMVGRPAVASTRPPLAREWKVVAA